MNNINATASVYSKYGASRDGSSIKMGSVSPFDIPAIEENQEENRRDVSVKDEEFKTMLYQTCVDKTQMQDLETSFVEEKAKKLF